MNTHKRRAVAKKDAVDMPKSGAAKLSKTIKKFKSFEFAEKEITVLENSNNNAKFWKAMKSDGPAKFVQKIEMNNAQKRSLKWDKKRSMKKKKRKRK